MKRTPSKIHERFSKRLERPPQASNFKQNGRTRWAYRHKESFGALQSCLSIFVDVYRHHSAVFARYRAENRCTPKQLITIEALYIEGISQNELAEREGVTAAAIESRIDALANKAPEFYRWWRKLNERRRLSAGSRQRRRAAWNPGESRVASGSVSEPSAKQPSNNDAECDDDEGND